MSKCYMMIGLPGSGKSYEARKIAERENAVIVSSDAIRGEINGDENSQENGGKVFEIANKRIREALTTGQGVIMDSTRSPLFSASILRRRSSPLRSLRRSAVTLRSPPWTEASELKAL